MQVLRHIHNKKIIVLNDVMLLKIHDIDNRTVFHIVLFKSGRIHLDVVIELRQCLKSQLDYCLFEFHMVFFKTNNLQVQKSGMVQDERHDCITGF